MRRHRSTLLVTVLAVGLAVGTVACGGDDDSTDEAPTTDTSSTTSATTAPPTTTAPTTTAGTITTAAPTTEVTTTAAPTTAAPETTAPSDTTPASPSDQPASFLIGGDDDAPLLPLGWWDGSAWRTADDGFPLAGGESAVLTSVDDGPAPATLSSPSTADDPFATEACFDGREGFIVDARLAAPPEPGFGYTTLAVAAPWDPTPRPSVQAGLEVDEYRQIGATFADRLGADGSAGDVVQVIRVDLDGDGVEEVLVTFERIQPSIVGAPGDYSIVYLRSSTATGEVSDELIANWVVDPDLPEDEFPFLLRSRVMAVADLDGDGTMEVAVHRWYYEGASVEVFGIGTDGPVLVASNGCGA